MQLISFSVSVLCSAVAGFLLLAVFCYIVFYGPFTLGYTPHWYKGRCVNGSLFFLIIFFVSSVG